MKTKSLVLAAMGMAVTMGAVAPFAQAQKKMYRCGSNYQDRPCEQAPAAPKPAVAAVKAEAPVSQSRAAYQQQLRCENYGRQMAELREKQKTMSGNLLGGQIKSLEERMKADAC